MTPLEELKLSLTGIDRCDPDHRGDWWLESRLAGHDWPSTAVTMIGKNRLDNLHDCVESVLADNIPGDFIETGVWRGGACIFMRAVLAHYGITDRIVWVADSFQGMPSPVVDGDIPPFPILVAGQDEVMGNFRAYGMLDDQVRFLPGWFSDTLPGPVGKLAVLRMDSDHYTSTRHVLNSLYCKLSPGGYLIVDDWNFPVCREAVNEYRAENGITEPILEIPGTGSLCSMSVYWRKGPA